jgi:hypothetical protein
MNQQLTIYVNQLLDLTLNLVHIKSQLCKKAKNKNSIFIQKFAFVCYGQLRTYN